MYFDRVELSGTQTSVGRFNVSFKPESTQPPDGQFFIFFIENDPATSKFVNGIGSLSSGGTVFEINTAFASSDGFGEIPSFTGDISVNSATTAGDLNRNSTGKFLNFELGQSNVISLITGADEQDFAYDNNLQWSRTLGAPKPVVEPMEHQSFLITRTPPCTSYGTGFGNTIIDKGHKAVMNVPSGADSSGFSTPLGWTPGPGSTFYNGAVSDAIGALDHSEDHYPGSIIVRMGESDFQNGLTKDQYRDAMVDMLTQFRIDVQAGTVRNVDMSKVPVIIIGLNNDFIVNNAGADTTIEAGHSEVPDFLPYSSYLSLQPWSTSTDNTHDDLVTIRRVGYQELYPKKLEAEANRNPSGLGFGADLNATASMSGLLRSTEILLNSSLSATASVSGTLFAPAELAANLNATASVAGTLESVQGAPAPLFLLNKGVNQTPTSGLMDTWQSTVDTKQIENLTGSFKGTVTGGVLDFPGTAIYNFNPGLGSAILNNLNGCTIIFDLEADTVLANDNIWIGTGCRLAAQGDFAEIQGTTTTWSGLTPATRQTVGLTIDRNGDFMKVFLDDAEDAVVNGIAALESAGDGVGDQQLGGTVGAYDGKLYNIYMVDEPLTLAQYQDAVATYFVT